MAIKEFRGYSYVAMKSRDMENIDAGVPGNVMQSEQAIHASELSYRRLFEAARDGILIVEVDTGKISDVNPFLIEMLGYYDEI